MDRNYRHEKHDEIAKLIREGGSDRGISLQTGADRRSVARVRRMLGVPVISGIVPLDVKLAQHLTEPDADGHVFWTGRRSTSGTPVVRHRGTETQISHITFRMRAGIDPVGSVKPDCGESKCVAGSHVMDDIERRTIRLLLRNVQGYPAPWAACRKCGADWNHSGRVDADLGLYCVTCVTARARRNRLAKAGW
jgi:hypothetical protein